MKTKLVYVLTCAPEATYIEQALMSVWTARYHNSNAYIVLLVDNQTNKLLVGKRAAILDYITEKIVVDFDEDKSMHYRSRWLKTKARELVSGDFLYIDCDTIITCDLSNIESVNADMSMVRDENVDFADEIDAVAQVMMNDCRPIGVDLSKEKYYFNGGVIYAKDTPLTHRIFAKWHSYWKEGLSKGINFDQPSLAKANIDCGHPIVLMDDKWNAIASTYIEEIYHAYILHFWRSVSFLYLDKCMSYVRNNGLTEFIKYYLLHPLATFIPSDTHISYYKAKDYVRFYTMLKRTLKAYGKNIDSTFKDLSIHMRFQNAVLWMLSLGWYAAASCLIVLSKWGRVKFSTKFKRIENVYKK